MLHGEIKVNGHIILTYQITNEGQNLFEDTDKYNYRAVVFGTDNRGYDYSYDWVWIDRGSAPYLIAKVMQGVDERLTANDHFNLRHGAL